MPTLADWNQVYDDLDWDDLLEPHPLNEGRVFWGLGLPPLDGGPQLYDLTQNTRGGTLTNGPTWSPTPRGDNGLSFASASSQYVDLGANVPLSTVGSFACWVFITSNPVTPVTLFGFGCGSNGNSLQIDIKDTFGSGSNRIQILGQPAGTNNIVQSTSARLVTLNTWHHIVVTADGSVWVIYLDGQVCALETGGAGSNVGVWTGGITTSGAVKSAIGAQWNFGAARQCMNGSLADSMLYSRVLSASDAAALSDLSQRGCPGVLRRRKRTSVFVLGSTAASFTATGTLASGSSSISAAATFRAGTHTAVGSLTIGSEIIAGSTTFAPGTHTANVTLAIGTETIAASSTFSPGTHTAVGSLTENHLTIAGSATFAPGTHTANGSLTSGADSIAGTATFSAGTHTANGTLLVGSETLAASATFAPGTHTANATLNSGQYTIIGSAEFAAFVGSTIGSLTIGSETITGSASFAPALVAIGLLVSGTDNLSASATFQPPFTVSGVLVATADTLSASGTFSGGVHTTTVILIASPSLIHSFVVGPSVLLPPDDNGEIYYSDEYVISRVFSRPESEIGRVYQ